VVQPLLEEIIHLLLLQHQEVQEQLLQLMQHQLLELVEEERDQLFQVLL
jgi:hypothetical protein